MTTSAKSKRDIFHFLSSLDFSHPLRTPNLLFAVESFLTNRNEWHKLREASFSNYTMTISYKGYRKLMTYDKYPHSRVYFISPQCNDENFQKYLSILSYQIFFILHTFLKYFISVFFFSPPRLKHWWCNDDPLYLLHKNHEYLIFFITYQKCHR